MALILMIFLPVAACVFWIVLHTIVASKTDTYMDLVFFLLCSGVFLFTESCRAVAQEGSTILTTAIILAQLFAPCIVPFMILYSRRLLRLHNNSPYMSIWIAVPVAMFVSSLLLNLLGHTERVDLFFKILTGIVFRIILVLELISIIIFVIRVLYRTPSMPGDFFGFFFRGKRIALVKLQFFNLSVPLVLMAIRTAFTDSMYSIGIIVPLVYSVLLTISAFLFGAAALLGAKGTVTKSEIRNALLYNYGEGNKTEAVETKIYDLLEEMDEDALLRIQDRINSRANDYKAAIEERDMQEPQFAGDKLKSIYIPDDENSLSARFHTIMLEKQFFLQPKLTMEEIAEELHTNKTYISKMVNSVYKMGFPELINTLRVDYAQHYTISHREARQDEIAKQSGFLSASSYNTIFKRVTGFTPKVWIASNYRF